MTNHSSDSDPSDPRPERLAADRAATGGAEGEGRDSLFRIMDAAANRCREGLRVLEDYVRMHLNDAVISLELKEIRHALTDLLNRLGQAEWISSRDTLHDVGTERSLPSEQFREAIVDVLRANMKRVEESLRSLEEYGKLLNAELGVRISQCRYRMYTVEKMLETLWSAKHRLQDCRLYLLVTGAACRRGMETVVRESVAAGVDVIQVREKGLADRELFKLLRDVRRWTAEGGALFIVNDRPDLAVAVGADGVHLGQEDLPVHEARRILGNGIIGVSTHAPEQLREALRNGADYLGVGPVFPSQTKEFSALAGLDYVGHVSKMTTIPWFAIGGVSLENLRAVQSGGATRVAVSSAICAAEEPGMVAGEFARRLAQGG